jgi:hypothetical protein
LRAKLKKYIFKFCRSADFAVGAVAAAGIVAAAVVEVVIRARFHIDNEALPVNA